MKWFCSFYTEEYQWKIQGQNKLNFRQTRGNGKSKIHEININQKYAPILKEEFEPVFQTSFTICNLRGNILSTDIQE